MNITISPSSSAITEKIEGFVEAYNDVISIIHNEFDFTGEVKDQSRLAGDSTLRAIQMQLSGMISSSLENLTGSYEALSQIGVTTGMCACFTNLSSAAPPLA